MPANKRRLTLKTLLILAVLVVSASGCVLNDTQKIDDANEAARLSQNLTGPNNPGRISIFDLRQGDCYDEPDSLAISDEEIIEVEFVEVVPCSGPHQFEVQRLLFVDHPDGSPYPGTTFFDDMFYRECPFTADFFMFPIPDSWEFGDRVLTCVRINE